VHVGFCLISFLHHSLWSIPSTRRIKLVPISFWAQVYRSVS